MRLRKKEEKDFALSDEKIEVFLELKVKKCRWRLNRKVKTYFN